MVRIFLAWLLLYSAATTVFGQDLTLQLVSPDVLWPQDSIPEHAGERVVRAFEYTRSNGETGYVPAMWIVVLINRPYEQTRLQLHDVVHDALGIESERELHFSLDASIPVAPKMRNLPLFGDGFNGFGMIGVPITAIREYRIATKQYNTQVRWWKSHSESEWRVIDGVPLFQKACSLLVVSRMDYSREWAWMHPGIPLPFTTMYDTRLVTDAEVALIATLRERLGQPMVQYFVPYLISNDSALAAMRAIRDAAIKQPGS
jgi:hypothetical protein